MLPIMYITDFKITIKNKNTSQHIDSIIDIRKSMETQKKTDKKVIL
jgi:hypothetical protein